MEFTEQINLKKLNKLRETFVVLVCFLQKILSLVCKCHISVESCVLQLNFGTKVSGSASITILSLAKTR